VLITVKPHFPRAGHLEQPMRVETVARGFRRRLAGGSRRRCGSGREETRERGGCGAAGEGGPVSGPHQPLPRFCQSTISNPQLRSLSFNLSPTSAANSGWLSAASTNA
jgi:hypothetical protein